MRPQPQTSVPAMRAQEYAEWVRDQKASLVAYIRNWADDVTDAELVLSRTAQKIAALFCKRRVSKEEAIRYTLRSLVNNTRMQHRKNVVRHEAEQRYWQEEERYRDQRRAAADGDADLLAALKDAMQQMPEESVAVMTMRVCRRMSFADIAGQLGISESTARRRYDAALEEAKQRITLH